MKRDQILTIEDLPNIKEDDIFKFTYNSEILESAKLNNINLKWCFDGILIAKSIDNVLVLFDSYWIRNYKDISDGERFEVKELFEKGSLKFICNLNDVESVNFHQHNFYADKDWFDLSYMNGRYEYFAIKKGAKKDITKTLKYIEFKIKEMVLQKECLEIKINSAEHLWQEVFNGNILDVDYFN